jgi:hypothetical protein
MGSPETSDTTFHLVITKKTEEFNSGGSLRWRKVTKMAIRRYQEVRYILNSMERDPLDDLE